MKANRMHTIGAGFCCLLLGVSPGYHAAADTVTRWTNAQGVTQFGDPQFAPPGAQSINIAPANGMAVPEPINDRRSSNGPSYTKLSLPPKRNKKGWRPKREKLYTGRTHQNSR